MTESQRIVEEIHNLLHWQIQWDSPVLSGNTRLHISVGEITPDTKEIIIDAPFYDMKAWRKRRLILHTGETIRGKTAYAQWANDLGAFATHNATEHWVNRCCYEVAMAVAHEFGGELINELPL